MRNKSILLLIIVSSTLFYSCRKDLDDYVGYSKAKMTDLKISEDFDFSTERSVSLNLKDDATENVKYYIYTVDGDEEQLIATKLPGDGGTGLNMVIPDFIEELKVVRVSPEGTTEEIINAEGPTAEGSFSSSSSSGCSETLYAVNSNGGFYRIDVESEDYDAETLSSLTGGGSVACAVNKDDGIVYYNTGTTLRYYDYDAETFHVLATGNPYNGSYPRMEYDHTSGLLYIGNHTTMYTINPSTNAVVGSYNIVGLESPTGGGDVAISKDGTIYLCCFSGLYRLNISGSTANATRISAENLPFKPTSMAIDRNDRLYLGTSESNSRLIEMDKVDGAWSVVRTYNHKINDLGSYKCDIAQLANVDTDNDGVIDQLDDFPDDASAASATYTPSELGWGTLAYEDLWPSRGDYDFNDMVVKYRFVNVENANGLVVRMEARFEVKAIGASYHNGFGFKMDLAPSNISGVTGYNITDNLVSINSKGLEDGHSSGSTIIVFDDAFDNLGGNAGGGFVNTNANANKIVAPEITVLIEFENPISPSLLGDAPFNPFIFINGDRTRELHLADMEPTDKADPSFFNTIHDESDLANDVYYRTANNLPWAINIIHEFRQPLEKNPINNAYNHFNSWSTSSGAQYKDWYKDNAGYRNADKIFLK